MAPVAGTDAAPVKLPSLFRAPIAVLLAWMIPGLGHIYLGHKVRGVVFLVAISFTFWTGVAIGGVKSVAPWRPAAVRQEEQQQVTRSWWFMAQMFNGLYAVSTHTVGQWTNDFHPVTRAPRYLAWPSGEVGSVYSGIAGLLNLLVIIDALARAEGIGLMRASARPRSGTDPPGGKN